MLGKLHEQLEEVLNLAANERVLVSCFVGPGSWYVFTTRRVVSGRGGNVEELAAEGLLAGTQFGNFKGIGNAGPGSVTFKTATLKNAITGQELKIEYETRYASMAPIYACKFWVRRSRQSTREKEPHAES